MMVKRWGCCMKKRFLCAAVPSFFICFMMRFLTLSQPFIFVHAQGVDAVSFENVWGNFFPEKNEWL